MFQPIDYEYLDPILGATSTELSSAALGARVLACSDEWFADARNLIKPNAPESLRGQFGPSGALYDGWETRRHNPAHDWALIRLAPAGGGHITGLDVDTSTFDGNEGPAAEVYGMYLPDAHPSPDDHRWELLLPRIRCGPLAHHLHAYSDAEGTPKRYTHVLLLMIPDGGFSRFRVYGAVAPAPVGHGVGEVAVPDAPERNTLDLAHALNGGRVVFTNDQHFGRGTNVLLPGRGEHMGDGWETKRSRVPRHYDWLVVKLGERGVLQRVQVDTIHFLGNYPESFSLHGCDWDGNLPPGHADLSSPLWVPLIGRKQLGPGQLHQFDVELPPTPLTHVRLAIYPDGGIKRLRLVGRRAGSCVQLNTR